MVIFCVQYHFLPFGGALGDKTGPEISGYESSILTLKRLHQEIRIVYLGGGVFQHFCMGKINLEQTKTLKDLTIIEFKTTMADKTNCIYF